MSIISGVIISDVLTSRSPPSVTTLEMRRCRTFKGKTMFCQYIPQGLPRAEQFSNPIRKGLLLAQVRMAEWSKAPDSRC